MGWAVESTPRHRTAQPVRVRVRGWNSPYGFTHSTNHEGIKETQAKREREGKRKRVREGETTTQNEMSNKEYKNMRGRWGSIDRKWNKKSQEGAGQTDQTPEKRAYREKNAQQTKETWQTSSSLRPQPDTQAATVESGNITSTTTQLICPRTSFGRFVGMSAAAFVLPNNIRRWAGRRDRACFWDGTDVGKECVRPVKHEREDCTVQKWQLGFLWWTLTLLKFCLLRIF